MNGQEARDFFVVKTPIGFQVRVTWEYWLFIASAKHPVMFDREREVIETLKDPSEVRKSKIDRDVYLFYRPEREG